MMEGTFLIQFMDGRIMVYVGTFAEACNFAKADEAKFGSGFLVTELADGATEIVCHADGRIGTVTHG